MAHISLSDADLKQIEARGVIPEQVISQFEAFRKGFPFARLVRPCTVGDGIDVLEKADMARFNETFSAAALAGRVMKFVPASGAATRMFKSLIAFHDRHIQMDENEPDHASTLEFIKGIRKFAFYDDLKSAMSRDGLDIEDLISKCEYGPILDYVLSSKGLDLAQIPKGLIAFHWYPEASRTAFEEQLVEATGYITDNSGLARVHFTVSPEREASIKAHLRKIIDHYEKSGVKFDVTFSVQKPSTDTIAAQADNKPFRGSDGRLVFRPGGHGALLENLNALKGDLVFIKNIDNVVPDRLKQKTYIYKKALGGYLIELQKEICGRLERCSTGDLEDEYIKEVFLFIRNRLCINPPAGVEQGSREKKIDYLVSRLNRPLRVCGMVKNEGEPGGGPFWVEHADKSTSVQIVESSQVDMDSAEQRGVWESSTHFNPVDLVCGVRDYTGKPFDLMKFVDPNTGFISVKSMEGRELKALELPGLWNGSMAYWNTVFVQVPIITFNPVKTVLDLLRKEHQPE
ncbi:MAG: DUF4301 family protein [Desulfobacteraceae bacterium]|jgi:hypothetical protein